MFIDFGSTTVHELTFNANGTAPIGDANDLMTPEIMENLFSTLDANLRRDTFVKTEEVTYGIEKSDPDDDSDEDSNENDTFNGADNHEPDEYELMALANGGEDWDTDYNAYEEFGTHPHDNVENGYWTPGTEVPVIKKLAARFADEEVDYSDFGQFEEPLIVEDEFDKFEALASAYRPNVRDTIRMNLRKLRDLIMNGKCRRSVPSQRSWKDSTRRPRPFRSFNGQVKRVPKTLR